MLQIENEIHRNGNNAEFWLDDAANRTEILAKTNPAAVQLVYLDPPFMTGACFTVKQSNGERVLAYRDDLPEEEYWSMMERVLRASHTLLSKSGSLYLHCDYRTVAKFRLLLDDIFSQNNFMNEIVWHYNSGGRAKTRYSRKHDSILFYRKSRHVHFDIDAVGQARGSTRKNHMKRHVDENGKVTYSIRSNGKTYYYDQDTLVYPSDVWGDISHLQQLDPERSGYATQKPLALLNRVVLASSRPGDLVMDPFSGSGSTGISALQNGRSFWGIDASKQALRIMRKRLLNETDSGFCIHSQIALQKDPAPIFTVKNKRICIDSSEALDYLAVGELDGKNFLCSDYRIAPFTTESAFPLSDNRVLHVSEESGDQFFYSI